jgi:hypothetical protein
VKSHFFKWFAKGATCYLNRFDQVNFVVPVYKAFILGKDIPNIKSMLTNNVKCAGWNASMYDMFNEYVKHCDGFLTLTKDTFKAKMISLKVEYSKNGRAPDNTIGCFKNIMSVHNYN